MGYIQLRRRQLWSAGASEARPRFGSLGAGFGLSESAVGAALCRRTPKVPRVAYVSDSSVSPQAHVLCVCCQPATVGWFPRPEIPIAFGGRDDDFTPGPL